MRMPEVELVLAVDVGEFHTVEQPAFALHIAVKRSCPALAYVEHELMTVGIVSDRVLDLVLDVLRVWCSMPMMVEPLHGDAVRLQFTRERHGIGVFSSRNRPVGTRGRARSRSHRVRPARASEYLRMALADENTNIDHGMPLPLHLLEQLERPLCDRGGSSRPSRKRASTVRVRLKHHLEHFVAGLEKLTNCPLPPKNDEEVVQKLQPWDSRTDGIDGG